MSGVYMSGCQDVWCPLVRIFGVHMSRCQYVLECPYVRMSECKNVRMSGVHKSGCQDVCYPYVRMSRQRMCCRCLLEDTRTVSSLS